MSGFVSIARIVKKRGVRGELVAQLLTDFPERFSSLDKVHIFNAGNRWVEELERYWFHKDRVILKFRGRERPEQTQELIGAYVQVADEERFPAPEGSYYYSDLVGCEVLEEEKILGAVTGIFETGGEGSHLVVTTGSGDEFMIPLVRKFVIAVDVTEKVIEVELPRGLLTQS